MIPRAPGGPRPPGGMLRRTYLALGVFSDHCSAGIFSSPAVFGQIPFCLHRACVRFTEICPARRTSKPQTAAGNADRARSKRQRRPSRKLQKELAKTSASVPGRHPEFVCRLRPPPAKPTPLPKPASFLATKQLTVGFFISTGDESQAFSSLERNLQSPRLGDAAMGAIS